MQQKLVLIRGLPGSGKSTIARAMVGYEHVEADMFFYLENPQVYAYDPSKVTKAHAWCQEQTHLHLEAGRSVVVANTFVLLGQLTPYFEIAEYAGILPPAIIEARGNFSSIHGVPSKKIEEMRAKWEPLTKYFY